MVRTAVFAALFIAFPGFVPAVANATETSLQADSRLLRVAAHAGQLFCRRNCMPSEVDAHLAASRRFLRAARLSRREVNWRVYRLPDATFTWSWPSVGESGATQSRMPPLVHGQDYISAGHIHWDDVPHFSAQDWNWVAGNRKTLYLATGAGILRKATPRLARRVGRSGGLGVRRAIDFSGHRVALIGTAPASPGPIPESTGMLATP